MAAVTPFSLTKVESMFPSAEPPEGRATPWECFVSALRPLAQCVCVYEPDGRCLFANKALARWLGRDEADLVGKGLADLWPDDFAAREADDLRLAIESGRLERLEKRPGAAGPAEVRAVKYTWRGRGNGPVVVVVFEGQVAPLLDDRPDQLGWMALGIVHDFNNALMMLKGQVEMLQATFADGRRRLADLDRLLDHAGELPRQLLALARGAAPALQRLDVNTLLRSLEGLLRGRAAGVVIEFRLDSTGAWLDADPVQLTQALLNLAGNALQAMEGKGRLVFETRVEGSWLSIGVRDTGPGMTAEVLARIFDPLYTTRRGGTGLGLAVVREVARRHGGRVGCTSELGAGSHFVIELPLPAHC